MYDRSVVNRPSTPARLAGSFADPTGRKRAGLHELPHTLGFVYTKGFIDMRVEDGFFLAVVRIVKREHRSEEHTSEVQSRFELVLRLLLDTNKVATGRS